MTKGTGEPAATGPDAPADVAAPALKPQKQYSDEQLAWAESQMKHAQTERMERLRALTALKKNPLYVWQAIAYAHVFGEDMPAWCWEYVSETAIELYMLMQDVCGHEFATAIIADTGHKRKHNRSPASAAKRVASALQITRKGYNAFSALLADQEKIEDSALFEGASMFRDLRTHALYENLQPGLAEALPGMVEDQFTKQYGTREHAEAGPERALATIKKRRNIGETAKGNGSDRQVRNRIREGRTLQIPNKVQEPKV